MRNKQPPLGRAKSLGRLLLIPALAAGMMAAGCDDDDPLGPEDDLIDVTVDLNATTVQTVVAGIGFGFQSGTEIQPDLTTDVEVTFPSAEQMSVTSTAGAATGDLTFTPCSVDWTSSNYTDADGPTQAETSTYQSCELRLQTLQPIDSDGITTGTISLIIDGESSGGETVEVLVAEDAEGNLTVNVEGRPIASGPDTRTLVGAS